MTSSNRSTLPMAVITTSKEYKTASPQRAAPTVTKILTPPPPKILTRNNNNNGAVVGSSSTPPTEVSMTTTTISDPNCNRDGPNLTGATATPQGNAVIGSFLTVPQFVPQNAMQTEQQHHQQTQHQLQPPPTNANLMQQQQAVLQQQLEPVDSALISALKEPRERFGLLRLEQNLVDFMRDVDCTYVQVGITEEEAAAATTTMPMSNNTGVRALQSMVLKNSFQRKCLHKLADRFHIQRETGGENGNNSIRLIKVQGESRVPSNLLIDLDLDEHHHNQLMGNTTGGANASNSGSGPGGAGMMEMVGPMGPAPQDRIGDGTRNITERLGSTSITGGGSNPTTSSSNSGKKSKKKNKTFKIMKRKDDGGNNGGVGGGSKSNSGKKGNRRKKLLSDKEKAYAEARARIFNNNNTTATDNNTGATASSSNASTANSNNNADDSLDQMNSGLTTTADIQDSDTAATTATTNPGKNSPLNTTVSVDSAARSQNSSPTPDVANLSSSLLSSPATESSENTNTKTSTIPASTTKATSKVTWRNRQQEQSDPDFRRGHAMPVTNVMAPPTATIAYNPYSNSTNDLQKQHMLNGYYPGGPPQPAPGGMENQSISYNNTSWQRQDQSSNGAKPQHVPPVIFSGSAAAPSHSRHGQNVPQQYYPYQQNTNPSLIPTQVVLGGNNSGGGNVTGSVANKGAVGSVSIAQKVRGATTNFSPVEKNSNSGQLVYTPEEFPALG